MAADLLQGRFSEIGLVPASPLGIDSLSQPFQVRADSCFTEEPLEGALTARNIIGMIEGETAPGELIIITANYDGLGTDPETGLFYPGADFNASGTAAVVELARVFSGLEQRPAKSVVFACLGAEECGSYGSRALADAIEAEGLKDSSQIINLQGLGAGEDGYMDVWDLNYRKNRPVRDRLIDAAAFCGVDLEVGGADPGSPASVFFIYHIAAVNCDWSWQEEGDHPDFHLVSDSADRINGEALRDATRVAGVAAWLLAR